MLNKRCDSKLPYGVMTLVVAALMLAACSAEKDDVHLKVRQTAQDYYALLVSGNYDAFVSGMAGTDSMPQAYRQQVVDMVAQYAQGLQVKGGMVKAVATRDSLLDSVAYVFLDVTFGDSTVEQVGQKLVKSREQWKMK